MFPQYYLNYLTLQIYVASIVLEEIEPGTKAITDPLSLHTSDV